MEDLIKDAINYAYLNKDTYNLETKDKFLLELLNSNKEVLNLVNHEINIVENQSFLLFLF